MNTITNVDTLTLADLTALREKTSIGRFSIFPGDALRDTRSAIERYDIIMQKLENAEKPMRAGEISKGSGYPVQAFTAILNKLCAAGIVRRVVIETHEIKVTYEWSHWIRVDDATKKLVPAGTPITVTSEIVGFELVR